MTDSRLHVTIRPMTTADVDQVVRLDRLSFPNPWPQRVYYQELSNPGRSYLLVMEPGDAPFSPNGGGPVGWVERIFGPGGNRPEPAPPGPLIGYSGFWRVADEAHISTIAIHPDWRGKKLGELLLWMMLRQALGQKVRIVTLEVRVSNTIAQNLYRKYAFKVIGRRNGYYSNDNEDAYTMGVSPLDDAYRTKLFEYGKQLAQRLRVTDRC